MFIIGTCVCRRRQLAQRPTAGRELEPVERSALNGTYILHSYSKGSGVVVEEVERL